MTPLRLGTRGSQLALWQARTVAARIEEAGGPRCQVVTIKTSGDRLSEANLSAVGGKRLFVKEIEEALLEGRVDLAVHSSKDMPAVLPDGLMIGAVLPREDPHDVVVLPAAAAGGGRPPLASPREAFAAVLERLAGAPSIGTGSVRRAAQLTRAWPQARFAPIRGNLDTRLRKLDEGQFDAIVLAAAGMKRLGFGHRISAPVPLGVCVPAPGQGIVAVEVRRGDAAVLSHVLRINDRPALRALEAERALVEALGGGCQAPIGAVAIPDGDALTLQAAVISLDGSRLLRGLASDEVEQASALGRRVAEDLLARGAAEILDEARREQTQPGS
jgi:hydroxymethylbilane synthase